MQGVRVAIAGEGPIGPGPKDRLLTTAQAAELLGLSETALSTSRSTGGADIPYLKIGGSFATAKWGRGMGQIPATRSYPLNRRLGAKDS